MIDHFDTSDFSVRIGGSIKDFDAADYIPRKDIKKMDPFIHYGMAAGSQAIEDSGLEITDENANRIGVAVGAVGSADTGALVDPESTFSKHERLLDPDPW